MNNDRIDILMDYTFVSPKTGNKYEEQIYIPTEIFCEVVRQYLYNRCLVKLDCSDSSLIHLLGEFEDGFTRFENDESFIDECREMYKDSSYEEDDLEDIVSSWED